VTPIRLERNISKTTGDRVSVPKNTNSKWRMGYRRDCVVE